MQKYHDDVSYCLSQYYWQQTPVNHLHLHINFNFNFSVHIYVYVYVYVTIIINNIIVCLKFLPMIMKNLMRMIVICWECRCYYLWLGCLGLGVDSDGMASVHTYYYHQMICIISDYSFGLGYGLFHSLPHLENKTQAHISKNSMKTNLMSFKLMN